MYDVIVIGGGPAALSAALNLKIREKRFIVLSGNEKLTNLTKAPSIKNYLGFSGISGKNLLSLFNSHAKSMNIEIINEIAYNILDMGDYFSINTGNNYYDSKTLIIATGQAKDDLMEGEDRYLGRGVGYCATCDGPLFKNKTIAIIAENEEGEKEAKFLSEICSTIYYLPLYKMENSIFDDIKVINETPIAIIGDGNRVTSLKTTKRIINVNGIFIIRNILPINQLIEGLELENGSIKVDKNMSTSIPGICACGDCTGKPFQISKAVGEGNIAALTVVSYIDGNRR